MLASALFFILAFATVVALLWAGFQLFTAQEDPLADRLEALQAQAVVTGNSIRRRRGRRLP
ncbi:MAG: hypothetical protein IPP47_21150 [Bryobacterales bacterium]|nr:hypothetical protein [Bryobacterales bacterium]